MSMYWVYQPVEAAAALAVAGGPVTHYGVAALTVQSSASAAAIRVQPGAAPLTVQSGLTAGATVTRAATASLTAQSGLTATGAIAVPALALLTAQSSLSATGVRVVPATAALTAQSSLTAGALHIRAAGAALTVQSDLAAGALHVRAAASTLTAQSDLAAAATVTRPAAAVLSAESSLSAAATFRFDGVASLTAESNLTANGGIVITAAAALTFQSDLTASASFRINGTAALTAESSLSTPTATTTPYGIYLAGVIGDEETLPTSGVMDVALPVNRQQDDLLLSLEGHSTVDSMLADAQWTSSSASSATLGIGGAARYSDFLRHTAGISGLSLTAAAGSAPSVVTGTLAFRHSDGVTVNVTSSMSSVVDTDSTTTTFTGTVTTAGRSDAGSWVIVQTIHPSSSTTLTSPSLTNAGVTFSSAVTLYESTASSGPKLYVFGFPVSSGTSTSSTYTFTATAGSAATSVGYVRVIPIHPSPTIVAQTASSQSSGTTYTPGTSWPDHGQDFLTGDLMILTSARIAGSAYTDSPTNYGWTLQHSATLVSGGDVEVYTKIATAADDTPPTWTWATSTQFKYQVTVVRDVDLNTPFDVTPTTSTVTTATTSIAPPSITPASTKTFSLFSMTAQRSTAGGILGAGSVSAIPVTQHLNWDNQASNVASSLNTHILAMFGYLLPTTAAPSSTAIVWAVASYATTWRAVLRRARTASEIAATAESSLTATVIQQHAASAALTSESLLTVDATVVTAATSTVTAQSDLLATVTLVGVRVDMAAVAAVSSVSTQLRPNWKFAAPVVSRKRGRRYGTQDSWWIGQNQGVTLFKKDGVWHEAEAPPPWVTEGADAVYLGGRSYEVSDVERNEMIAAGYESGLYSDSFYEV